MAGPVVLTLLLASAGVLAYDASCATRTTPSQVPHEQLCYLLLKNRQTFDISWNPPHLPPATFQNHIPYELVTLYKLGGTAERLQAGYDAQAHVLDPLIPSQGNVTAANWRQLLGADLANPSILYSDYVAFYRSQMGMLGVQATIAKFLPTVAHGLFGRLWHGFQTLGYGYGDTADPDMVAQGLAWMSTAYQPPAPLASHPSQTDLSAVLLKMHQDSRLPVYKGDPSALYFVFLADLVANHSSVMQEYDLMVSDSISLEEATTVANQMRDSALKLFIAANASSFTHVHMVSSVHAVVSTLPYADANTRATLLRREWQAILYNYGIQSRPSPVLARPLGPPVHAWGDLVTAALNQTDVHVHEIVHYLRDDPSGLSDADRRSTAQSVIGRFEAGLTWSF